MKIICHRGNQNGPNPDKENHPDYLLEAIKNGFDVELDVRFINNKFVLGHDAGIYEVSEKFLFNKGLWIHCKNIEALYELCHNPNMNIFYHDQDDCVLTSHNYIWTFPKNQILTNKSIAVMPERVKNWKIEMAYGVCTDFPKNINILTL